MQISQGPFRATGSLDPLYVIVLNWNQPNDTIACVHSLLRGLPPGAQLIVVDNGSDDQSVARLQAEFGATIALVAQPHNQGFAAGMNAGITVALAAGAGAVLLLNNDTIVDPAMLGTLGQAAAALPQAGMLGPAIYYYTAPTRLWQLGARRYPLLPVPRNLGPGTIRRARGQPVALDYLTGCAMLIRREVLEQVGLLDPSYRFYFEDADFSRRVRNAGFEVWGVPAARMWHKVSLSAKTVRPATRYAFAWGRGRFYRIHPHGPHTSLTLTFLLVSALVQALRHCLRGEPELARLIWRGTLDGYALRPPNGPLPGDH
ncbi:MAG: glycosyltransferase family 2 protein [Oscillochloridaceae bacterium umkhey_bin13]